VYVLKPKDRATLQLQWVDPDTGGRKTRSAGTADEKAAEQARADLEYELNNGKYQEASRMSWERFRELFEAEYVATRRPDTRKVYDNVFNLFEKLCHPRTLRAITERTVSSFAAALRKQPGRGGNKTMAPLSVKVRLQFLHTALQWAANQKLIPECPRFPAAKVSKKKPQPVPVESFERLLAKAPDDQTRAFLLTGWLAGLRRNEALALEWEESDKCPWLDFARQRIVLPAELVKADEDQWVPLDPTLRAALEALPRQGPKVFRFLNYLGQPLTPSGVSLMLTKLAKAAGVKLSMKTLRKGFGCRYAGKVSAQVLQKLMRHANISTTMAYYANVDEAVMEAVLGTRPNGSPNTRAVAEREGDRHGDATPVAGTDFGGSDE
jgi:integrase